MYIKKSIFTILMLCTVIYAGDLTITNNSFRVTYDSVSLPADETMGLAGINYLRYSDNFYYGMGLYGALEGKRGGFFSGGLEFGYKYPLYGTLDSTILFDVGAFAGGGSGGGSNIFGNGLMLRSHAGIIYDAKSYQLGITLSNITFPGSETNSNQLGLQLNIPFQTVSTSTKNSQSIYKDLKSYYNEPFGWRDQYIAATFQQYSPTSKSKKRNGQALEDSIGLIGFEYGYYLNDNVFTFIEASESSSGDVAGYAEVIGGIGYDLSLTSDLGVKAKVAIGSGGGSGVNVGGGLLTKLNAGVYYKLIEPITLSAEVGYIDAPDGAFSALNQKIMLSYNYKLLSIGKNLKHINISKDLNANLWRMRFGTERYMASSTIRTSKKNKSADLIVFKFDRFITDNFYVTGQGFGAYRGDISGYGGGFLGFGYQTDPFIGDLSAYAELLVGPGGAGGVAAGDGLIAHPMVGLNYEMTKSFDLQVGIGHVQALSGGTLDTNVFDIGLVYKFNTIEL